MRLLYEQQAREALQANLSPRFRRLDRLEKYVDGSQYDGKPSFFDSDVPMYDRAPCVVYPIVAAAIRSNVDLCLGEGRWPCISSFVDESDEDLDDTGLGEDDSELLDRCIAKVAEQARVKSVSRELLTAGQGGASSVAICGVRSGKLFVDTTRAKWCKPTFDESRPDEVVSLEIRYPYLEEYFDDGEEKWALRCMLYRRVIDAQSDVTFQPVKAREDGKEPHESAWIRDDVKSVDHALGFCPVVWYRFMPESTTVADYDGKAIHCHLTDEVDALNFGLSQRHVAAMVASSPPTIETGVEPDHSPSEMGRRPHAIMIPNQDGVLVEWAPSTGYTKPARKRGPGIVWRYPSAESRVSQLTMPGDALKPIDEDCRDLRAKLAEALAVVFTDPENASAEMSGRALREHHKRQIERCDVIRDDFGTNCILRIVDMLLRLCLRVPADRLRVPGIKKLRPLLERFETAVQLDDGTSAIEWTPPAIKLVWGEYFTPTEADQKQVVDATIAAKDAGLITLRTAVERMKNVGFVIDNVDEYVDALEEEAAAKSAKSHEDMAAAMALTHEGDEDSEGVEARSSEGVAHDATLGSANATPNALRRSSGRKANTGKRRVATG